MEAFLNKYSYLITIDNTKILYLFFFFILGFFFCYYITEEKPFASISALVKYFKNKIGSRHYSNKDDYDDEYEDDEANISFTGGSGAGTVTETLARNTQELINNGKKVTDDFGEELLNELKNQKF